MLSEAENIEPDLIGKLDFLNEFPQPARTFRPTAIGGVGIDIRKCVKTCLLYTSPSPRDS